jgi:CRISPR/Cas system-associated endonuclease Cas3-HD
LAESLGLSNDEVVNLASYLAGIHDLGKCHPSFQEMDGSQMADYLSKHANLRYPTLGKYRHEKSNAFMRIWESDGIFESKKIQTALKTVIKLHHQGKQGDPLPINKEHIGSWPGANDWLK